MTNKTNMQYREQYQIPNYLVETVDLVFEIFDLNIVVNAMVRYYKNPILDSNLMNSPLVLNGNTKLLAITLDSIPLDNYRLIDDQLIIDNLPNNFILSITTEIDPFNNKSCVGLYSSGGNLFTQCEAEGFRKITYYQDRPDILARFTTKIIADINNFPVILSNGNKISSKQLSNNRHEVTWHDPFYKPSYLFALVAGKFAKISDQFITKSGRTITLEIYSEAFSIDQCYYCLESLKRAMLWDEQTFNLEYDLDNYLIVVSNDFNFGAMENKGLNIFNSKYVLADSKTATDNDFINVEAVVGHEYFHNWSGNRVTCRDWFQLSLKEGLTVFRDQEFTASLHGKEIKRINDVKLLRNQQFSEDNSPLSHSVRPDSCLEINNFYTTTLYEKGAELIRMYQTILGNEGFKRGLALYFKRHDGCAVTCDEFYQAMSDANNYDFKQFMLWYSTPGTPRLTIRDNYDPLTNRYTVTVNQTINQSFIDQKKFSPLLIPLAIGFISDDGFEITPHLISGKSINTEANCVLLIDDIDNQFIFNCPHRLTISLNRNFSAPVIIDYPYTDDQLFNLAINDSDSFNRWNSIQDVYRKIITSYYNGDESTELEEKLINALTKILANAQTDPALLQQIASLPNFSELALGFKPLKINQLTNAINLLEKLIADKLETLWCELYHKNQCTHYDLAEANYRKLKNCALYYLLNGSNYFNYLDLASNQYATSDNMTDKIGALDALNNCADSIRDQLLNKFYHDYQNYPLVLNKWFYLQSQSKLLGTIDKVAQLLNDPAFENTNPNKLYSLVRAFTDNHLHFNTQQGYTLVAEEILRINKFNPSVAGRIAHGFSILPQLSHKYQEIAKPILTQILASPNLSKDVLELIDKINAELSV